MPLILHKTSHSVTPWHISVEAPYVAARYGPLAQGRLALATCRFRTRREALPLYQALLALPVDWDRPILEWPVLHRDAVTALLADRLAREAAVLAGHHAALWGHGPGGSARLAIKKGTP